jgi:hypothetical protein
MIERGVRGPYGARRSAVLRWFAVFRATILCVSALACAIATSCLRLNPAFDGHDGTNATTGSATGSRSSSADHGVPSSSDGSRTGRTDTTSSPGDSGKTGRCKIEDDAPYGACQSAVRCDGTCVITTEGSLCAPRCETREDCPTTPCTDAPVVCAFAHCVLDCSQGHACPLEQACTSVGSCATP